LGIRIAQHTTDEGPITHITNGVHTLSWLAPEIKKYYDKYLERNWARNIDDPTIWDKIDNIPDEDLWKTHTTMKTYMIWHIRRRLKKMKKRYGVSPEYLRNIDKVLDPNILTIGFARRFATYKRADLLFRDYERIKNLITNKERPIQFIFAGKAHPADQPGKEIIKKIFELANRDELWYNVVLVEDYDMELARYLVLRSRCLVK
jgi:starch phosphorylase